MKMMEGMNVVEYLKKACISKPYRSFSNLANGDYEVQSFEQIKTSFGNRIRIELSDCVMYLPERFANILTEETIARLNESTIIMAYSGKDPNAHGRLLLDFEAIRRDDLSTPLYKQQQQIVSNITTINTDTLNDEAYDKGA